METLFRAGHALAMRRTLCASCLRSSSRAAPASTQRGVGLQNSDRIERRFHGHIANAGEQAKPIEGFYAGWYFRLNCLCFVFQ